MSEWKTIDSVTREEVFRFLVFRNNEIRMATIGWEVGGVPVIVSDEEFRELADATHWMPLPAPPEA